MQAIQQHPLYAQALKICKELAGKGFIVYFAGGCVRDALLGRQPQDLDIATSATPDQVRQIFAKTVPIGVEFGVVLVIEEGAQFEVTTFREDGGYQDGRRPESVSFCGPEIDAQRRDFTMNALFYDPLQDCILDYVQGRQAIENKMIVAVGDAGKRFAEDHLRILRALRFAAQLDFTIEEKTFLQMQKQASSVQTVSAERLQQELEKMLCGKFFVKNLGIIIESQILHSLFPEAKWQSANWPAQLGEPLNFLGSELQPQVQEWQWLLFWVWYQRSTKNYSHASLHQQLSRLRFSSARKKSIEQAMSWLVTDPPSFSELSVGALIELAFTPGHAQGMQIFLQTTHVKEQLLVLKLNKVFDRLKEFAFVKPEPLLRASDLQNYVSAEFPEGLQGAALGAALKKLYHLQLEGVVKTKSEGLEFLKMPQK